MPLACDKCGTPFGGVGDHYHIEVRNVRREGSSPLPHDVTWTPTPHLPRDVVFCNFYCFSLFMMENPVRLHTDEPKRWPAAGQIQNSMPWPTND